MVNPLSNFQVKLLEIIIETSPIDFKQQVFNFISHYNTFLITFENRQKVIIEQFILKEFLKQHNTTIQEILKAIYSTTYLYIPREVSLEILKEHCQETNINNLFEDNIKNNIMINILMNPLVNYVKKWIKCNSMPIVDMSRSVFSQGIDGINISFISRTNDKRFRKMFVEGTIEMIATDKFFGQVFTEFFIKHTPSFNKTKSADMALKIIFKVFFTENALTSIVENFKAYFLSSVFKDRDRTLILERLKNKLSTTNIYTMPSLNFLDE